MLAGTLRVGLLSGAPDSGAVFTLVTGDGIDIDALADPAPVGAVTFDLALAGTDTLTVVIGRQALTNLATTPNQAGVAGALDRLRGDGAFDTVFDSLDALPAPQLAQALDRSEEHT